MLPVRTAPFENPARQGRHWYLHLIDTESETGEVTECARGFAPSATDPTQVCPDSSPRPGLTQMWGKGKDTEREDSYFEITGILSRKK